MEQFSRSTSTYGVELRTSGPALDSKASDELSLLLDKAFDIVAFSKSRSDTEGIKAGEEMRQRLLACFPETIFVETIPNGYCPGPCCLHRPWLKVTTPRGRITIGWRKRVIEINWEDSVIEQSADALFIGEDTTKVGKLIHAWGYEKAREYLTVILRPETRSLLAF